jgi:hypothetical protein
MIGNYIKAVAVAVSRTTAQLMKTGQTTSYRTGDDGDLERGRNVSFTVLAENNPFGNTNRFTDELGGQTYTNNIVIDWSTYNGSTVLGWRRTASTVNINWNTAIDQCLTLSIGTFTSGWRLPNIMEYLSIFNYGASSNTFNYAPFNVNSVGNIGQLWTSTTAIFNTGLAYTARPTAFDYTPLNKFDSSGYRYLPCRTFTVTGTTLS